MKGMMVTLLVLLMTGTVIAQQQNQQNNADKPGSFVLWLNDELIQELKTNPSGLVAGVPIDARGKVTEVSLRFEKEHTDSHDEAQKPGRFNLWLDDALLTQLKTNKLGLVAELPKELQGKLVQVVLKYESDPNSAGGHYHPKVPEPDNSSAFAGQSPRRDSTKGSFSNSDFSLPDSTSNRRQDPTYPSATSRQQVNNGSPSDSSAQSLEENLRRLREQSAQQRSADEARRRTAQNQQQQYGTPPTRNDSTANSGFTGRTNSVPNQDARYRYNNNTDDFRPRFDSSTRNPPNGNDFQGQAQRIQPNSDNYRQTTTSPVVDNSDVEFQSELFRREAEKLRNERLAGERLAAQQALAEQKAQYEDELFRQRMRSQNGNTAFAVNTQGTPEYLSDRYAMRTNPQQPIPNPTYQFPTRRAESFAPSAYDYERAPSRQKLNSSPRIAQNGNLIDFKAAIPGNSGIQTGGANNDVKSSTSLTASSDHLERSYKFMYFMLMFSIGLNVYLAWISRGFYIRYNELADELRETFTTTI